MTKEKIIGNKKAGTNPAFYLVIFNQEIIPNKILKFYFLKYDEDAVKLCL